MKSNEIIFYSPTKAENPWIENAASDARHTFTTAVMGLLVRMDADFNISPMSLESYRWDYKNKHYVLKLKPDLYFTNGRKVTIEDLEFSILRHFFATVNNEGTMRLINIKGVDQIKPNDTYESGKVEGVKILDRTSLAVTPSSPNPSFMYTLARWNFSLAPREELQADLLNWKKWPIGVGPYKITAEDKQNKSYVLELIDTKLHPNAPQKIIFEQERKIKPDLTLRDELSVNDVSFKKMELLFPQGIRLFSFNYASKLGNDPNFRKAISIVSQRKKIAPLTLTPTKPLNELVTKGAIGRLNIEENYNTDLAKQLFQKSLGTKINEVFKIPHTPDLEYLGKEYREEMVKQFAVAGLKVEFVMSTNLWNPFSGEHENSPFCLYSKGSDYFDPLLTFLMFSKGSPAINKYPNDDKLEQLIGEARASSNRDILGQNIKNLSQYFIDQNIVVPLLEIPTIVSYNPQKIKSVGEQVGGQTFHLVNVIMNKDEEEKSFWSRINDK